MKKIILYSLIAIAIITPLTSEAITGDASRFDWTAGIPAVVADNTITCNDTATVRFDWSGGRPTPVFDATANCITEAGAVDDIFWFE